MSCISIGLDVIEMKVLLEIINVRIPFLRGPGSVVGIATGYGLDGSGIESQ
jgi:hypothetical protein